jgi:hypothetical protein
VKQTLLPVFPVLLTALSFVIGRADEKNTPTKTDTTNPQAIAFFENKVRPVLFGRCFSCHGESVQQSGLRLDSLAATLKGGKRGPAIVPGKPEQSLLVQVIGHTGDVKMPPNGKLPPDESAALITWVKQGAVWPEDKKVQPGGAFITPEKRNFWSFRPVKKPVVPTPPPNSQRKGGTGGLWKTWVKNPIDAFILAKLETKGLKPAPLADRRTLIRRVTYDLIGLPPTPEEVEAFVNDKSPRAWEKVIDRLLASPHYGERWGRHWLDVARYADSNGLDENTAFGNAFRYRDYVIAAFNADKPYNQFIIEQIAGDLLPTDDQKLRNERLTATGFLVLGAKVLAEPDKPKMVMDIVDEQLEVVTKSVMGLTVTCARCHDHKFDPISTKDYYALAGIFKSTRTMETLNTVARVLERPLMTKELEAEIKTHNEKVAQFQSAVNTVRDRENAVLRNALKRDAVKYLLAGWEYSQQPGQSSLAEIPAQPGETRRVVEAEKFDRGNVVRDFQTYGEGIGVIHNVQTPDVAEWDIEVPAGNYQIELRYASNEKRPVKLSLNGKVIKQQTAGQDTGSFQRGGQRWEVQGIFSFQNGKNTLRLDCDGPIPHFDKILLASVVSRKPDNAPVRTLEQIAQQYGLLPAVVKRWGDLLAKGENSPILYPFVTIAESLANAQNPPITTRFASNLILNDAVKAALNDVPVRSVEDLAETYGRLFVAEGNGSGLEPIRRLLFDKDGLLGLPEKPETYYPETAQTELKKAEDALKTAQKAAPKVPITPSVEEQKKIENCRVHLRGSTLTLGDEVPRRFLTVLGDTHTTSVNEKQSGRLELAQWLVRPDHPLTARVAVNRIWQHHFGEGFVRTPDNYGLLGERPTHSELLDWLAATFVEDDQRPTTNDQRSSAGSGMRSSLVVGRSSYGCDWSMKKLHRLILLSNTYKMSSANDPKAAQIDPDNRLLWRSHRRRLEAEPFRDAILAVSGSLDRTLGGSLLASANNEYVTNDQSTNAAQYNAPRRSVYLPVIRNAVYDVFQAFDFGDPSMVNAKRASTTIAPQALFAMNSPFILEQAKTWAANLLRLPDADDAARLQLAYRQAFARPPQPAEIQRSLDYLARYATRIAPSEPDTTKRHEKAWASLCHLLFASNEFIYLN